MSNNYRNLNIDGDQGQERIMAGYRRKGYVKTAEDEQYLHMSFSPFKVPKNLTSLQIRRRINKYKKGGFEQNAPKLIENRLTIYINDKMVLGSSFSDSVPNNSKELHKLLSNEIFDSYF